jgi:hypothetical protein
MRFHLSMMLVVIFVSMTMHAMASAATPVDPTRAQRRDAAVHDAGETLNTRLKACREEAARQPKASKRDLAACERAARKDFRADMQQARNPR